MHGTRSPPSRYAPLLPGRWHRPAHRRRRQHPRPRCSRRSRRSRPRSPLRCRRARVEAPPREHADGMCERVEALRAASAARLASGSPWTAAWWHAAWTRGSVGMQHAASPYQACSAAMPSEWWRRRVGFACREQGALHGGERGREGDRTRCGGDWRASRAAQRTARSTGRPTPPAAYRRSRCRPWPFCAAPTARRLQACRRRESSRRAQGRDRRGTRSPSARQSSVPRTAPARSGVAPRAWAERGERGSGCGGAALVDAVRAHVLRSPPMCGAWGNAWRLAARSVL